MVDNVGIKDKDSTAVSIAAKDIGNVLYPKHMMVDKDGNDIDWGASSLISGTYRDFLNGTAPTVVTAGSLSPFQTDAYGAQRVTQSIAGREVRPVAVSTLLDTVSTFTALDRVPYTYSNPAKWSSVENRVVRDEIIGVVKRIGAAAASVNATLIKNTPCLGGRITGYNAKATAWYLKIYDKITAPNAALDVPVLVYYIEPTKPINIELDKFLFRNGMYITTTTLYADTDTTALVANDFLGLQITTS